jgi:hypothetical protein
VDAFNIARWTVARKAKRPHMKLFKSNISKLNFGTVLYIKTGQYV